MFADLGVAHEASEGQDVLVGEMSAVLDARQDADRRRTGEWDASGHDDHHPCVAAREPRVKERERKAGWKAGRGATGRRIGKGSAAQASTMAALARFHTLRSAIPMRTCQEPNSLRMERASFTASRMMAER